MNPEMASPDYTDETENPKLLEPSNGDTKLLLPPQLSTDSANAQWQQYGERIAMFLRDLPTYVTRFFEENKGPLGGIGLIVLALVTVKVILALVDAIDDIPLVAPTLELIGLGYGIWFVYRYLLQASSRQELSEEIKTIKERVLGTKS
ncbi:MAG: CAAD domain-containing protein [Cyanobacteriota bacterium]|nr:CAAD domain-containing protein [Cyanobacteriota bacterium]